MPPWAHQLSTFAALGFAVAWLAWRWLHPAQSSGCSSCSATELGSPAARGRRSPQLKILD